MIEQYPVTPPPELVEQIRSDALRKCSDVLDYELRMIHAAYRAGADQELEACCEWLYRHGYANAHALLPAARRPKSPSLKEQALAVIENSAICDHLTPEHEAIIRRALEALPD